jgi:PAS domain S-box-containing protein
MTGSVSAPAVPTAGRVAVLARRHRIPLLLLAIFVSTWFAIGAVHASSRVAVAWPAAGFTAGLLLIAPDRRRIALLGAGFLLVVAVMVLRGTPVPIALAVSASTTLCAITVRWRLHRGLDKKRVGLLDQGDVSRLMAAVALGALVAALGTGLTAWVADRGHPQLTALSGFGSHAASLMILLPFFVEAPQFPPLAARRERVIQSALTLGATTVLFLFSAAPPLVFAVMPMFAWLAFRGTLREASLLLVGVSIVANTLTAFQLGPVWDLQGRYDLPPQLAGGFLQLFLLDCALLLLPLSVMVTQQRTSAARAASRSRTLERLISSATGTAVIATDEQGRVTVFNPGAEAMLGCPADDVMGRLPDGFFPDHELARHAERLGTEPAFAQIAAASAATEDSATLGQFRRHDGECRTLRMTVTAVQEEEGGEITGHLCIAEDVTEREAAHRALVTALDHERSAVDQLRELERVKADFVATVSHELRTPITSMVGYLELLEDGAAGDLNPAQLGLLERVERNGRRLQLLVEDLLMLSDVEARRMTINPVETDLREPVQAAYDALAPLLAGRRLDMCLRLPEQPVLHEADPEQVERMVLNLLTNAVKFTPDGGRVETLLKPGETVSEVVVRATGIGIPEQEQDQLFTRFFRSSTATPQAIQGTGLGLTIVQAIAGMHGGEIRIGSVEGKGTTATARLPRVPGPAVDLAGSRVVPEADRDVCEMPVA